MNNLNQSLMLINEVQRFEAYLGNPNDFSNLINFESAIQNDEESRCQAQEGEFLNLFKLNWKFIPKQCGGDLSRFDEMMLMFRSVYRRDPALALGYGFTTFMAAIHVWVAGNDKQKKIASDLIKRGKSISVTYHERQNGNDLFSSEVAAILEDDGYSINGEKWIINNAKDSRALTLFAKTDNNKNARSYSLFFIEKNDTHLNKLCYLQKVKTLGVKACKISGIKFKNYPISIDSIIKGVGCGFELTLKSFQVTRAILPGISLGTADTFLKKIMQIKSKQILLPIETNIIVNNFLNLVVGDVMAIVASRAIHVIPRQLSAISAMTKYFIPKYTIQNIQHLSQTISIECLSRNGPNAILQKILRDYPVVSLGHSSDVICLSTLLQQIKNLLSSNKLSRTYKTDIRMLFDLESVLPDVNFDMLQISNFGYMDIINSIYLFNAADIDNSLTATINSKTYEYIVNCVKQNINKVKLNAVNLEVETNKFSTLTYNTLDLYVKCYAMMCCLHFFTYNQNSFSKYINVNELLLLINNYIFNYDTDDLEKCTEQIMHIVKGYCSINKAFSVLNINY